MHDFFKYLSTIISPRRTNEIFRDIGSSGHRFCAVFAACVIALFIALCVCVCVLFYAVLSCAKA